MGRPALHFAILAGLVAAGAGWTREPGRWRRRLALGGAATAAGAAVVALFVLAEAFWSGDFAYAYVADHARRGIDDLTRLAGVWGGMAGSLLVLAVGNALAGVVAVRGAPAATRPMVAAVAGGLTAAFLAVAAVWSDPFVRLEVPAVDGAGLTPILEHPAMLYHPPLLYAGLTAVLAPFALTVAALARHELDDAWATRVRRWLVVPWTLLALGMATGAHWAYVELGWGGYWAWDPVENTGLLPWLAVTAALHGLIGGRAGQGPAAGRRGVASLVLGALVLSVLGGLLTRSGATSSVHAFAESRSIGRAFGVLLVALVALVATLVVRHRRGVPREPVRRASWPPGRLEATAAGQFVLLSVLGVVLIGSVWPLVSDLVGDDGVAVEGWYFAAFCGPLALVGLACVAVGPLLDGTATGPALRPPTIGAVLALTAGLLAGWRGPGAVMAAAVFGAALAGTTAGALRARRALQAVAPHIAHLGMVLLLAGVAGTTTGATELHRLAPGGSVVVDGHRVVHHGVRLLDDPRDGNDVVVADVSVDGRRYQPELVAYPGRGVVAAESSLRSTPWLDVQIMLRDGRDDGTAFLQIGIHPLQQLVWWGALVMIAGGTRSLTSRSPRRA